MAERVDSELFFNLLNILYNFSEYTFLPNFCPTKVISKLTVPVLTVAPS